MLGRVCAGFDIEELLLLVEEDFNFIYTVQIVVVDLDLEMVVVDGIENLI